MSVITISRGPCSGGKTIAECLARNLGYRWVDREVIVERAAAQGVSQEELRDALQKPPTFLERIKHRRYMYLVLMQAALAEEVQHGRTIYHGNAGHLLLGGGGAPVLRVRIIAPIEFRIQMAQKRLALNRDDVIDYLEKADEDRRKWTQFLYGVDWHDPSLYDVVVNLEHVTTEQACAAIAALARARCGSWEECRGRLRDLVLAAQVRRALVLHSSTAHLELDVESKDGVVSLRGRLPLLEQLDEVHTVARSVPGVVDLETADLAATAFR